MDSGAVWDILMLDQSSGSTSTMNNCVGALVISEMIRIDEVAMML
jgi:hypothetical protein